MASHLLTPPPDGDVILSNHYIAGISVMTVLAVLVAWLRMYTRMFVSRNTGWDDWTMFAASLILIATNTFLMSSYHYGLGRHIYYLTSDQISQTFKWLWAAEPTNLFAVFLVRLSISLFFLRLIPPKKAYLWIIRINIVGLVVSDVFISIYYFFACRPIRKVWEPETPGQCFGPGVDSAATWLYQAVSILSDIILLVIPIRLFWRLHVPTRTKLALMFICCLGIFTSACAVVKTVLLVNLFSSNPDKTWIDAQLCLWAPMELCVGTICGSIPTLRPLFATPTTKSSGSSREPGLYKRFGESPLHELTPIGGGGGGGDGFVPTNTTTTYGKRPRRSRSTSRERIIIVPPSEQQQQIRRTFEVEINHEATTPGSSVEESKGRTHHGHDWNPV